MSKTIIPYGNRFLVKRRPIGGKLGAGILVAADQTAERPTDIADVVYVPNHTFADKELISNAEEIVKALIPKVKNGDVEALKAVLDFNAFIRIKAIKVGDTIMLGKYVGTDFNTSEDGRTLTMCLAEEIIGLVKEN